MVARTAGIRRSRASWASAALLTSAALFFVGTGLNPVWWATWLAPVPVLVLATRMPARPVALVASAAAFLGMGNIAPYLVGVMGVPFLLVVAYALGAAGVFTGAVLLFRVLMLEGCALSAVLATPAVWASAEYLVARATPGATFWTIANSQADNLPILQLVSLTGPWGVGFVLFTLAAALAAASAPAQPARVRWRAGLLGAMLLALTFLYGGMRLESTPGDSVPVSLVAAPRGHARPDADTPEGQALIEADLDWVHDMPDLPAHGARLVVFPEKDLIVDDASLPDVALRFTATAREKDVTLVLGVEQHSGAEVYNTALAFAPDGSPPVVYHKQQLLPGFEDEFTPGEGPRFARGFAGSVGLAICADLGEESIGRAYARNGAGLLAVPALDFDVDAWSTSRLQFIRGVENGYSVARAARQGYLTLSDGRGRVLAQARVDDDRVTAVTAELPIVSGGTLYTRGGDWFAWVCLALTALSVLTAISRRSS